MEIGLWFLGKMVYDKRYVLSSPILLGGYQEGFIHAVFQAFFI